MARSGLKYTGGGGGAGLTGCGRGVRTGLAARLADRIPALGEGVGLAFVVGFGVGDGVSVRSITPAFTSAAAS